MKFGVVVFPGSNCDHDAFYAINNVLHKPVEFIWHQSEDLATMMRNSGLRFICRHVYIRVEQTDTPFTNAAQKGQILQIPIAHSDGNYNCDEATLAELEKNRQVIFRYTTPDGSDDNTGNPNGAIRNIAGVCNRERNVAGLMPHPERAVESLLGSEDGLVIFRSMVEALVGAARATA